MSRIIKKRQSLLALVAVTDSQASDETFQVSSYDLERSFHGWLSVAGLTEGEQFFRLLTTEDFMQVELATVRESHTHRLWPRDVVEKFFAKDLPENQDT